MSIKSIFSFILCVTILFSCKKDPVETDNLFKFRDYISYTTSGRISASSPIKVSLSNPVDGWEMDKELPDAIFSIQPHVQGQLIANNTRAFSFIPDETLEADTEYTVTVSLKKIYGTLPKAFNSYTFKFKTIAPNFNIVTNQLQSYSKEWQYLLGVVKSADYISLEQAKQLIKAYQDKKQLQLEWNELSEPAKQFEFKIDSIHRKIDDTHIKVSWDGKAIAADTKGENTVAIPGINNFIITKIDVIQEPEQYLSINFSDPLKKQQNFDGLITIQNSKNPKYSVDGNILKAYPSTKINGNVQVDIFQGITNTYGYKLKQPFSELISFEEVKPEIRLVNSGVILPNSEQLKFNFEAVNLKAVDIRVIKIFEDNVLQFLQDNNLHDNNSYAIRQVGRRVAKKTITLLQEGEPNTGKWKTYSVDLSTLFKSSPGAIYRVEVSFKKNYSLYDCAVNRNITNVENNENYFEDEYYEDDTSIYNELSPEEENLREENYWDNLTYNYRSNNYNWNERNNPCHDAYYNQNREVAQNLIASNLGVIVKKGANNNYLFAVTNLLNTQVEPNALVTLYNFQQQEITSKKTNTNGIATIDTKSRAAFAVITKGNNTTYVKLDDGNSLSLSKFDVSGNQLQRGLKGYIYGERGVWRPGDSLYLSFILDDNANKLPKGHPVKMEVTDPNGKLVYKNSSSHPVNSFYTFTVPTSTESKTGNWNAKVSVGGAHFYKPLKVETVKPNRLKLKVDFTDAILTSRKPLNGTLQVNWLHGAPAKQVKAEIKAKFSNAYQPFPKYKKYTFSDPSRRFSSEEISIFESQVNADGFAKIDNTLAIGKNAPGMLNVQFLARAFENGGDFSMDAFTKKYAPYASFVGLQSPEGKAYGSYFTDQNHTFDIITVDNQGQPIQQNNLEVKVYKVEWRWWWNSSEDNLSKYTTSAYHKPFMETVVNTDTNGKAQFKINVPEEESGRYLIRVSDPKNGHATGRTAYFYKNWWTKQPSADKEAAKMLVFAADKENYTVGETAKITFPSGTAGRALVSIENGTEVLDHIWVETSKGETVVDIPITKNMTPNVFVNISLLQPHATTANDLPLRLYGVIPLLVEDKNTKLEPEIKMPDVLRPEEEFSITVSEKNDKAMTYTIAVVEEGLLDLTRFKTPNAWDAFYAREALGVKTWDVFDDVVGAYSGSIEQIFAIGGDGNAAAGKAKKANRFKPVVTVLGPFSLKTNSKKTHTIKMPNYIGAVRTMVVAGNTADEAYGSAEKSVEVKKPLMVLASLPRKLSPGEKVTLPVTVFAMEPRVKNVTLKLKLSDGITATSDTSKTIHFDKPDEKMAYFELDVSKANGLNTVEVIATGNGETAIYKVEIDVVNPNPITSKVIDQTLEKGTSETLNFDTFGVTGSNFASVEFSTMPPMDFTRRLQFLMQYPHGCLEQTTSAVFPQLYLNSIFDLPLKKKQELESNIKKAIKRLGNFQRPNGGMSYWLGENHVNDWSTSYAGHFMIEAEKQGYVLPITFKSNWLKYQKETARNWRPSYKTYNSDLAQAYRLYTLALAGSADLSAMNRLKEFTELSNEAKWRLAAAYALAGQNEASNAIAKTANIEFESPRYNYYTYGSVDRNRAMALETMVITQDKRMHSLAKTLAKNLSSDRWMSTQTTAYSLLALSKMVKANGGKSLDITYTINGKTETIKTNSAIAQRELKVNSGTQKLSFTNNQDNVVYIRVLNSGKLPLGDEHKEQRGLSVGVVYKDLKGNPVTIDKLKQGDDFMATVTVTNLKHEKVNDIALTQIFPSGWEIVNTRFTAFGNSITSQARYTDVRDDRVNFYFDLHKKGNSQDTKTFNVLLNASYLGTYYLPGIQAEAMYDNEFLVRGTGQWISVEK
ncbi:MAG: alpha-2-macroglobulin family protein [Bizionia paragorgiae]|uniref:alpha-2-macroglobulin family protein n=1 Tax=Bizionia paragorgiae TaxID=283786 RepID=UPI003C58BEC4